MAGQIELMLGTGSALAIATLF